MTLGRIFWQRIILVFIALALPSSGFAAPFTVDKRNNLWNSATLFWNDLLTSPPSQEVPLGTTISGFSSELTLSVSANNGNTPQIVQRDDTAMPGVYATCGPESSFQLNLSKGVQGFGAVMEPETPAKTRFVIEFFSPSYQFVYRTNVISDGGPVYVGGIDPKSELFLVLIYAVDEASKVRVPFYIGDLEFQLKPELPPLPELPIDSYVDLEISPTDTYLHRGLGAVNVIPATDQASEDHDNCIDLFSAFPLMRAGDILLFQRNGASFSNGKANHLLGVFMGTNELLAGNEFQRIPAPVKAGRSVYTNEVRGQDAAFATPTNIAQDFLISTNTFISMPTGARYIFFSKSVPTAAGGPLSVRINHIQRLPYLDYLSAMGFYGENAAMNSDLDGDGLTLIEEFAFGHDPTVADREPQDYAFAPNGFLSSGNLRIAFGARTGVPLLYHAEFSDDMVEWDRVSNIGAFLYDNSGQDRAVFAIDDPEPGPSRFGRIVIEYLPPIPL
ncbi:hypothetical protein [Cerasicoccus fimbriatus]|uniref:hypothetical protein n=1 Tax=Cerasicoccus fimbriatus TaxID=3014554 RepID=UPI0022B4F9B5|nr:hypothetical protein [Cerasicoccus sp. TK19100]